MRKSRDRFIQGLEKKIAAGNAAEAKRKKKLTRKRKKGEGATRRELLVNTPLMVLGGAFVVRQIGVGESAEEGVVDLTEQAPVGSVEFMKSIENYKEVCEMPLKDYIAFEDEEGAYIGKPVYFQGTGDPTAEWIEEERKKVCTAHGFPYEEGRSPKKGYVSLVDAMEYHGDKNRSELGGKSPIEYVKEHAGRGITSSSPFVKAELTRLLPGVAAQESQYNNGAHSHKGASGVFQFMPDTWKRYRMNHPNTDTVELGKDPSQTPFRSLPEQTHAAGWYMSVIEDHLEQSVSKELGYIEKKLFSSRQDFEKYFLVPCIINSYNAGEGRMRNVINWFYEKLKKDQIRILKNKGYDAYHSMTAVAKESNDGLTSGYGTDASSYFYKVYAFNEILERPRIPEED